MPTAAPWGWAAAASGCSSSLGCAAGAGAAFCRRLYFFGAGLEAAADSRVTSTIGPGCPLHSPPLFESGRPDGDQEGCGDRSGRPGGRLLARICSAAASLAASAAGALTLWRGPACRLQRRQGAMPLPLPMAAAVVHVILQQLFS